jgi:hypothetical protein
MITWLEEQVLDVTEQNIFRGHFSRLPHLLETTNLPVFDVPKGEWYRSPF